MEQLLKLLDDKIAEILTILFFSGIGFCIYLLADNEPIKKRMRGAFLGFFISAAFSYPTWLFVGGSKWWALAGISSVLTISGQFLPELIQSTFRKYAINKANGLNGGHKNDDR